MPISVEPLQKMTMITNSSYHTPSLSLCLELPLLASCSIHRIVHESFRNNRGRQARVSYHVPEFLAYQPSPAYPG